MFDNYGKSPFSIGKSTINDDFPHASDVPKGSQSIYSQPRLTRQGTTAAARNPRAPSPVGAPAARPAQRRRGAGAKKRRP